MTIRYPALGHNQTGNLAQALLSRADAPGASPGLRHGSRARWTPYPNDCSPQSCRLRWSRRDSTTGSRARATTPGVKHLRSLHTRFTRFPAPQPQAAWDHTRPECHGCRHPNELRSSGDSKWMQINLSTSDTVIPRMSAGDFAVSSL